MEDAAAAIAHRYTRTYTHVTAREVGEPWEGVLYQGAGSSSSAGPGLVVLAGSSGRIERTRARIFAEQGLTTLAIRWFGGPGQSTDPCDIPLSTFTAALDFLEAEGVRRTSCSSPAEMTRCGPRPDTQPGSRPADDPRGKACT